MKLGQTQGVCEGDWSFCLLGGPWATRGWGNPFKRQEGLWWGEARVDAPSERSLWLLTEESQGQVDQAPPRGNSRAHCHPPAAEIQERLQGTQPSGKWKWEVRRPPPHLRLHGWGAPGSRSAELWCGGAACRISSCKSPPSPLVGSLLAGKPRALEIQCFTVFSSADEGDPRLCGLGRAGWVGVPPPPPKTLARRGALAAKQILFQTSPLAPEGVGNSGPSHREARGAAGAPPGFPLPPRAGRRSRCRRTPWLCGRASCPALLSGPQAGARQERERDTGHGRGRGDAQSRSKKEGGRGPGPRGPLQHRAGGQRPPRPSARPAGAGKGQAGQGAAWSGVRAGAWVTFPGPGCGRAGAWAVSGGARSGWPGPCGAPGTAAAAEGHGEEGASHGGAPRPPPASERDDEGGAAAARRAPGGGAGAGAGATEPRPPLHSQTLPPRPIRWDPGAGACDLARPAA